MTTRYWTVCNSANAKRLEVWSACQSPEGVLVVDGRWVDHLALGHVVTTLLPDVPLRSANIAVIACHVGALKAPGWHERMSAIDRTR